MNMKAAASLTGSLLARKGAAYPAAYSAPSGAPATDSDASGDGSAPERAYNDPRVIASAPPPPAGAAEQGEQLQDGRFASEVSPAGGEEGIGIPQAMDKMGRVRLSVRLDPDRYLRVKMASARTRWSAQDIVIAALDRYLGGAAGDSSEGDDVDGGSGAGDDEGSIN